MNEVDIEVELFRESLQLVLLRSRINTYLDLHRHMQPAMFVRLPEQVS